MKPNQILRLFLPTILMALAMLPVMLREAVTGTLF
jgi:hypothetical protein